jgi:hypothetical protein
MELDERVQVDDKDLDEMEEGRAVKADQTESASSSETQSRARKQQPQQVR